MTTISTKYPFVGCMDTRQGGRSENQDSGGYVDTPLGLLVVVCDGMGGGPGGRTASQTAVSAILGALENVAEHTSRHDALRFAIEKANDAVYCMAKENPELMGMGTTVAALIINEQSAVMAHVGDSRIYQLRKGTIVFRSADHSVVADLVRQHKITEEEARQHPRANVITRALGIRPQVEAEVDEVAFLTADRFVICSDGIWGAMPQRDLVALLQQKMGLAELVDTVATQVDKIGQEAGGNHDNLTLAVVDTTFASEQQKIRPVPKAASYSQTKAAAPAAAAQSGASPGSANEQTNGEEPLAKKKNSRRLLLTVLTGLLGIAVVVGFFLLMMPQQQPFSEAKPDMRIKGGVTEAEAGSAGMPEETPVGDAEETPMLTQDETEQDEAPVDDDKQRQEPSAPGSSAIIGQNFEIEPDQPPVQQRDDSAKGKKTPKKSSPGSSTANDAKPMGQDIKMKLYRECDSINFHLGKMATKIRGNNCKNGEKVRREYVERHISPKVKWIETVLGRDKVGHVKTLLSNDSTYLTNKGGEPRKDFLPHFEKLKKAVAKLKKN